MSLFGSQGPSSQTNSSNQGLCFSYVNKRYFESEPWKLKSSHSDRTFYVHEDMLKNSCPSLYSVCNRMWAESQERVYTFDKAVSEEVISCFLNFLYHKDYSAKSNDSAEQCANSSNDKESSLHPLLLHAELYVFADTYIMSSLKGNASWKLKCYLRNMGELNTAEKRDSIFDLIEYTFDNLREDDALLVFLADYVSFKLIQLRLSYQRLETLLLGSDGKFIKNLLPRISGSSKDPFATVPVTNTDHTQMPNPISGTNSSVFPPVTRPFAATPRPQPSSVVNPPSATPVFTGFDNL